MKHSAELHAAICPLIESYFPLLRRTVRKNLARLTTAFLALALSVRFGYGGLHLTSVARALSGQGKFKSRYKWLARFLKCRYFDPSTLAECMLALILGRQPPPWVIVLVDQTTIDGVEVVNAALPLAGRAGGLGRLRISLADPHSPFAKHPGTLSANLAGGSRAARGAVDSGF